MHVCVRVQTHAQPSVTLLRMPIGCSELTRLKTTVARRQGQFSTEKANLLEKMVSRPPAPSCVVRGALGHVGNTKW